MRPGRDRHTPKPTQRGSCRMSHQQQGGRRAPAARPQGGQGQLSNVPPAGQGGGQASDWGRSLFIPERELFTEKPPSPHSDTAKDWSPLAIQQAAPLKVAAWAHSPAENAGGAKRESSTSKTANHWAGAGLPRPISCLLALRPGSDILFPGQEPHVKTSSPPPPPGQSKHRSLRRGGSLSRPAPSLMGPGTAAVRAQGLPSKQGSSLEGCRHQHRTRHLQRAGLAWVSHEATTPESRE